MEIRFALLWIFLGHLWVMITSVNGQNEICHFNGLNADCRYRVDLICLSHITAVVDPCADPITVKFTITCSSPSVDFSHTFSGSKSMASIPGYYKQTFLEVKMKMKENQVLNIEADIHVYGQASADFINDDVDLAGYNEKCPGLNEAAKIALGVMGGLAFIAACLVFFLLYLRYKRRKKQQSRPALVDNSEDPGQSTPRTSRNFDIDIQTSHAIQNSTNDRHVTNQSINSSHVIDANDTNHVTSSQDNFAGLHNESWEDSFHTSNIGRDSVFDNQNGAFNTASDGNRVRYSDVLQTQSEMPLKISDC